MVFESRDEVEQLGVAERAAIEFIEGEHDPEAHGDAGAKPAARRARRL